MFFQLFPQLEEESIYQNVTEEEYRKIVRKRQKEGIVDGDGAFKVAQHSLESTRGRHRGGKGEVRERGYCSFFLATAGLVPSISFLASIVPPVRTPFL